MSSPTNQTVALGRSAQMKCVLKGVSVSPQIHWLKDGKQLQEADVSHMVLDEDEWLSSIRLSSVHQADTGSYWCRSNANGFQINSKKGFLSVEGLPHFTQEPEDLAVFKNTTFNMTCAAVGSPKPTTFFWKMGGAFVSGKWTESPSVLRVQGINQPTTFSCEAHNSKGVAASRIANVKVLPDPPRALSVTNMTPHEVSITWTVQTEGFSKLRSCTAQVVPSSGPDGSVTVPLEQTFEVPPYEHMLEGLKPFTHYIARLRCTNQVGDSHFTNWTHFSTLEAAPGAAPKNVTFLRNKSSLVVGWQGLRPQDVNGVLLGYRVDWSKNRSSKEITVHADTRAVLQPFDPFTRHLIRVQAFTVAGAGPWSQTLVLAAQPEPRKGKHRRSWAPLVIGILCAALTLVAVLLVVYHTRKKELQFGKAFGPTTPGRTVLVQYRAVRTYNRQGTERLEATFDTLGISESLKQKLQDIFIPEQQLILGRTLGRGEFGSVKEAQLKMEDGSSQKVAVKIVKTDVNSSGDIEELLREAACMKDFDHPNVIKVIGVSLQSRANRRLPVPMVLLPFMKHGDLHSFLVMSRLGEQPTEMPVQTLLKFMIDIARGMEYLSQKNFIHRDLATRNCMLNEDMGVCVADFGLSRKLYSGDYYRQGSAGKLPVKWIALESLADNVYTLHSDVWSFGVTMWEISTRGQTPYPGIENAEIYDYLLQGHRLKQPPHCTPMLYQLMSECWHTEPKLRPSFQSLRQSLEELLAGFSPAPETGEHLYMNLREEEEASGLKQACGMGCWEAEGQRPQRTEMRLEASSGYRYVMVPLDAATEHTECNRFTSVRHEVTDPLIEGEVEEERVIINL
eukprot:gi/632977291/ref/XP_007905265.1/ PREDICTED: tyrosine-protein kinase receptor TYRO3-like [Callorhinchus milii]